MSTAEEPTATAAACDEIKELLIVGAGPHALTLLLRLLDEEPDLLDEGIRASISMDDAATVNSFGSWPYLNARITAMRQGPEARARFVASCHKTTTADKSTSAARKGAARKTKARPSVRCSGSIDRHGDTPAVPLSMLTSGAIEVIDSDGEWMAEWHRNFDAYKIQHLRSPVDVHPGPHDMRELQAFANITHRSNNSTDLVHMVGMDRDKVYKGPYQMPSTVIFRDYINTLIDGYGVRHCVKKDRAVSIAKQGPSLYAVTLESGRVVLTKRVVCAMGPNLRRDRLFWEQLNPNAPHDSIAHAHDLAEWLQNFSFRIKAAGPSARRPRVVIVGGGITSAHVVRVLRDNGCDDIKLLVRSELRTKQFDLHKSWFGPKRGELLREFWSADVPSRLEMIKKARGGGSMPPEALALLSKAGKALKIHSGVEVSSAHWTETGDGWSGGHWSLELDTLPPMDCDVLLLATGADIDIDQYPVLNELRRQVPVRVADGFPVLQPDLSWAPGEQVYLMGTMAALELGPDALNLAGARHGACRLAHTLRPALADRERDLSVDIGGNDHTVLGDEAEDDTDVSPVHEFPVKHITTTWQRKLRAAARPDSSHTECAKLERLVASPQARGHVA